MAEPIAIVGSACRFPGSAVSPSKLWELLKAPKDVVRDFPSERLNFANFHAQNSEQHGCTDVQGRSYLLEEDCRYFDASFFRISPYEAQSMDPQQRVLLETVYEAIEAAGWPLQSIEGSHTSVYVGSMTSDFGDIQMRDPESLETYTATGVARSILSNRISYFFDLKGPSITIDTACSSSLVALHQAVQSLRNGDASQAIVAGVTLLLDPAMYIAESNLHMLSPDSRSRMWDIDANGYARGEGCAAVILKPLSQAIADNDHIECIVRETGVNADGRTNGITMPSSFSQTALIRQTYEKAGLDPVVDRCQYFECHGTGTPAGDPIEAQAIKESFFPDDPETYRGTPLYCGSIKTVVGHLEGCTGLAGVLKASLAIRKGMIPPNMHFQQINPAVKPFYDNLLVPTSLIPWPDTNGGPLRASVNSFGFGGTNAHAILESYEQPTHSSTQLHNMEIRGTGMETPAPFVFSAKARSALLHSLKDSLVYLRENQSVNLDRLSWTLHSRRSVFPIRVAISAMDPQQLIHSLEEHISIGEKSSAVGTFGVRALTSDTEQTPGIIGIFTGQGAQWECMGRELLLTSPPFRRSLEQCDIALKSLPDGPKWSLIEELQKGGDQAQVNESQFSQPLCTAIQIALVDLLRSLKVKFSMVVGHSSGEIAAAYSAGILGVKDALGIAYYRGLVAKLSRGDSGQKGSMMAVGMSLSDATAFCSQPQFLGRIRPAASNSPSSITLSGDADAIVEANEIFRGNNTFSRLLKVDTAYHSHHMRHCAESYMNYLHRLQIYVQKPEIGCTWISSVRAGTKMLGSQLDSLTGQYWVDNMVEPVMFSQALDSTLSDLYPPAVAIEVGPHPALKGPVSETAKATTKYPLPYVSCLNRRDNDVKSMSSLVGFLWSHLGPDRVDINSWRSACGAPTSLSLLKDLPPYPWDHDQLYWRESRISRNYRLGSRTPHELLGRLSEEYQDGMTWRNFLRLREMPWLAGHMFENQVLFPAAGYVSMASQASMSFARDREIQLIEIQALDIIKPLVVDDVDGVETIFTVRGNHDRQQLGDDSVLKAEFACYTSPDMRSLVQTCRGQLVIYLGSPLLDVGFQAGLGTFASTAENSIGRAYLPTRIERILIDPSYEFSGPLGGIEMEIDSYLVSVSNNSIQIDVDMCSSTANAVGIQVEGLILKPVAEPQPSDDRLIFAKTVWDVDASCCLPAPSAGSMSVKELEYIDAVERTALFFMRNLTLEVDQSEISTFKWHHQQLFRAIEVMLKPVHDGSHAILRPEWLNDDRNAIRELANRYPDSVDLQLLTASGESWPQVLRGESEMLEHMLQNDLLSRLYTEGRGFVACNNYVADYIRRIAHKYPHTKIMEIGAGTGATTQCVLDAIGDAYSSWTYTDISAGFFEKAANRFSTHAHKFSFKTFDIEKEPVEQDFAEESYDIVIAANVLHATRHLSKTMAHTRSLLRPGGFLVMIETTGSMLRETGLMGGLEGWWLGADEGRFPSPGISVAEWHEVLLRNRFSGVNSVVYDAADVSRHNCSVFVTQAIDDLYSLLHDPLSTINPLPKSQEFWIIGGKTPTVSRIVRQIGELLGSWTQNVTICDSIDDWASAAMMPGASVLCLAELDSPIFSNIPTQETLSNLHVLLGNSSNILWVTSGRLADDPYSNMMVGIGRALAYELPHLQMQFLDFDGESSWDAVMIVRYYLRMVLLSSTAYADHNLLWTSEPEVIVNNSMTLIPRLVQDDTRNESLNAKRRRITRMVNRSESVTVSYIRHQASLVSSNKQTTRSPSVDITVRFSAALHVNPDEPCFLCFGRLKNSGEPSFAISRTDSSNIAVPATKVFKPSAPYSPDSGVLTVMGAELIGSHVLSQTSEDGTVLIHEPPEMVANAISKAAETERRKVLFITTSDTDLRRPGWININPLAPQRNVRRLILSDATNLINFSTRNLDNIIRFMPKTCQIEEFKASRIHGHQATLENAYKLATSASYNMIDAPVNIANIGFKDFKYSYLSTVLDWNRSGPVEVVVSPRDTRSIFCPDKTYLLVGLASELGHSLCRFMLAAGANHIMVASRNALRDASWIQGLSATDADIRAIDMDVTNPADVKSTATMIRSNMPELAGVMNAAMVLEDALFVNTDASRIERQLKPKVDGTVNLDKEFNSHNLDFFIAFSSLGSVYGNAGQSVYHAANMFMTSLIEQRRRRGLSGSVVDIGMISDIGYVARNSRKDPKVEEHLRSQFYTPLSEAEFHHLIVQAVLSGHPGSDNGNLTMGIQCFTDDQGVSIKPPWRNNPRFSHMVRSSVVAKERLESNDSIQMSHQSLGDVKTIADATDIYQKLFQSKVEAMMRIPASSVETNAPLSDLGLDSLVAVEIRMWVLKVMDLDLPLVRILNYESISSICSSAARKLFEQRERDAEEVEAPQPVEYPSHYDNESSTGESSRTGEGYPTPISVPNSPQLSVLDVDEMRKEDAIFSSLRVMAGHKNDRFKISRAEHLSYAQSSMHFLQSLLDDQTAFNVTAQYEIHGHLNIGRFARALEKVLAHHEAYRTRIFTESGSLEPKQGVLDSCAQDRLTCKHSYHGDVDHEFLGLTKRHWRLDRGDTFQAALITTSPESHTLVMGCHHIIMDGMSWHIYLRDLDRAYQMLPLGVVEKSYIDFSRQQILDVETGRLEDSTEYWHQLLQPIPDSRKQRRSYGNRRVHRELLPDLTQRIRETSQKHHVTAMHFYLSTMLALLNRILDVYDICVGVTDAGRLDPSYSNTIGHFINILPMRFDVKRESSFAELLRNTSQIVLDCYEHSAVPLDVILERLHIQRPSTYTPLFQIAFNYRVGELLHGSFGDCTTKLVRITQTGQGGHLLEVISCDNLYSATATEFVMDSYVRLLELVSLDSRESLHQYNIYSPERVEQAIDLGRGPSVHYNWPDTLTARLGEVVLEFPDSTAIIDEGCSMTYKQIATRIASLAVALKGIGAGPGSRVAVLCEPSIDTYVAMLAILHIGAVYTPLDLSLPAIRHRAMLKSSDVQSLLYDSHTHSAATKLAEEFDIEILDLAQSIVPVSNSPPSSPAEGGFLLFTSGSTGTPKGILLKQGGMMNYAAAKSKKLGLGQVRVLQQSSTGFDISIAQAFNAFANGGTLIIASSRIRGDPVPIAELIYKESIEMTICTPTEYRWLTSYAVDILRRCSSWKYACSGGEAVSTQLISGLRRLGLDLQVTDCYGLTEASCAVTLRSIPLALGASTASVTLAAVDGSVGWPIPNTRIYIVDDQGSALPPLGIPGEIYIGGRSVAESRDPFATPGGQARGWETMYKTGDRGYLREDGSLVYLGRLHGDTVVKLNGLRIDLEEVSNALLHASKNSLADVEVTVRGEPQFLVAHAVPTPGVSLSQEGLDGFRAALPFPRYMIPSMIVLLDRMPTSPNGKVDRGALRRLPLPVQSENVGMQEPLSVAEEELRLVWKKILGEAIGSASIHASTDFFVVGGSSLQLVRLKNVLKEKMGVRVPLQHLYQANTLAKMASLISAGRSRLSTEQISWDLESEVPDSLLENSHESSQPAAPCREGRRVVLTGAASFLGSEILTSLIKDDNVSHVYCIALPEEAAHKLPQNHKLTVYVGSLTSTMLGLSADETRTANYLSTQFLASMALPRRVPLHFVSSGRVILQSNSFSSAPVSMATHPPPTDGSQGYTSSKWVSERFLEKLAAKTSLPVAVHRICSLVGDRAPHDDAMNSIIRYSKLAGAVPAVPNTHGYFDFMDVVLVADEIARGPVAAEGPVVSYRHHSSGVKMPFDELGRRMEVLYGKKLGVVGLENWIDRAVELGIESVIVSYLKANVVGASSLTFPYLGTP
ncbi:lovastatin nonaketide synthase [Hypoxylon cercidicola]|nr:lovastatin nonaketide synthase [Hypoxylon cercidicola]